jgi:hypothetical protein
MIAHVYSSFNPLDIPITWSLYFPAMLLLPPDYTKLFPPPLKKGAIGRVRHEIIKRQRSCLHWPFVAQKSVFLLLAKWKPTRHWLGRCTSQRPAAFFWSPGSLFQCVHLPAYLPPRRLSAPSARLPRSSPFYRAAVTAPGTAARAPACRASAFAPLLPSSCKVPRAGKFRLSIAKGYSLSLRTSTIQTMTD